jgi:CheY-like chemotaxis protein
MKSTQKGLVIYVDDDPDDLYLVSKGFFKYAPSIDLITVKHGLELLDCLKTLEPTNVMPCLIIIDINMPGMDGKTTLKELRK